ncbi:sulfatase-like hydrolase/transferase [Seonamhaeicola marinus]|uniref:Sulfatase-like hydrolase/transferase n=1 Tax=Seonamhaeicola marinus TaxID=1912246 RepID=A0A5D0IR46_9FLAO|nr:sulfatase-like hydrolase/transferase [Seonamhaeicola marinus]TYA84182.1 sulfatase-like hydrolase/transferase [Seonamhaeicola marinus]
MRLLVLFAIFCVLSCAPNEESKQPNIILIMADDLGFECIGSYGGTSYKTPNIDKLAQSGIQFNQAYAQPLCTNTRVKLMTGKYNFRNWTAFGILDPEEKTFGHLMQDAGYNTCIVGKWQLQSYDPPGYPGSEYRRDTGMKISDAGFDNYCGWHVGHTEEKGSRFANPTIFQDGKFLEATNGKYGPDVFVNYLNDFVNKQSDKPFFVYYPMALTHDPFSPTPDSQIWSDEARRLDNEPKYFGDMVAYADKLIGKIVANLEAQGLEEETLILFYSDNGTHQKIYSKMGDKVVQGGKGLTTQAGIKVPFVASWKGKIDKGQQTDKFIDAIDFLPTLLDVAGVEIPEDFQTDGESFLPILKGKEQKRRDWVYMSYNPKPGAHKAHLSPAEFVMNKQYKLYGDGRFYNFENDVLEANSISPNTEKEKQVKERFQSIIDSLKKYPTTGSIERLAPELDSVVSKHARIDLVAEGFNWSEGPVWQARGQNLYFSDVPENKVYKWNDLDGLSVYMSPSGYSGDNPIGGEKGSNGLAIDENGDLILCQHGNRAVSKLVSLKDSISPVFEPLVSTYKGKKFNSPNDLFYDKEGNLYFTDPPYGLGKKGVSELGFNGVYFLNKEGDIKLVDKDLARPNGVVVSNDGKILYVAESNIPKPLIWAYDIVSPGVVKNKRVFFNPGEIIKNSTAKQNPDGIKLDQHGNIFVAAGDGILIITPEGKHIGTINTGRTTGNCVFNDDYRYLFITADNYLLRVNLRPYAK